MRPEYFWNFEEFLIDGVPVSIGETNLMCISGGQGRIQALTYLVERVFHRKLLHKSDLEWIIKRHYDWPDAKHAWDRIWDAEWAYKSSYTGYMTKRQLVKVLPPRRRCKQCQRKAQFFKPWLGTGQERDHEFCSSECAGKYGAKLVRDKKRRERKWQEIRFAQRRLRAVRKWIRHPESPDPLLFPSEESGTPTTSRE